MEKRRWLSTIIEEKTVGNPSKNTRLDFIAQTGDFFMNNVGTFMYTHVLYCRISPHPDPLNSHAGPRRVVKDEQEVDCDADYHAIFETEKQAGEKSRDQWNQVSL